MSTPRKTDRLELDLHDLSDDMSLRDSGHSFVYHPKNDLATAHLDVTARRLLESENGEKMMRDGNWHPKLTADYLRQVDLFRKLLLFCVHVTGGQPARGTEILSLRLKNGCVRPRNIFLLDGHVLQQDRFPMGLAEDYPPIPTMARRSATGIVSCIHPAVGGVDG
ncbi:hypothetical protein E4U22_002903 [Claviceps purpurea]|nr:hypothetical protein E4U22_002903 [Claviceps purpurea]